jgi:hypothetical protein
MPDLGFASIQKWIGATLVACKEVFVGPVPLMSLLRYRTDAGLCCCGLAPRG